MDCISFVITRRCNAACQGCPVRKEYISMTPAVFEKAAGGLHFCLAHASKVKFFGGEPLLEFSVVRHGYDYLKENGFGGTFELGTNGTLLDACSAAWLADRPDMQVNFNAWFPPSANAAKIKNAIWNICIPPENPSLAAEKLVSLQKFLGRGPHRINLLPAAYCLWKPEQLALLDSELRSIMSFIREKGLFLENLRRSGASPLFNDGPAADADGKLYISNICLAGMPAEMMEKFRYVPGKKRAVSVRDLINVFGMKKIASSFAASRILQKHISYMAN